MKRKIKFEIGDLVEYVMEGYPGLPKRGIITADDKFTPVIKGHFQVNHRVIIHPKRVTKVLRSQIVPKHYIKLLQQHALAEEGPW